MGATLVVAPFRSASRKGKSRAIVRLSFDLAKNVDLDGAGKHLPPSL
jgi:hypothetical protein